MATIVNQREVLLQATTPRMVVVSRNFITVTATTNAFSTTATGTSPSSIIVRASLSGELRGTVTWTTSPLIVPTVDGNTATIAASSVAPGTSVTVTATLTAYGQTYTNSLVISNSAETVASSLSSTSVSVSTAADGTGGSYASATSTMSVFIGTADNSTAWTYSWNVPAGVTASGDTTSTIAVSAMTVDTATLTCTATRTGWPTQTKTFTVSKSKSGTSGTNGTNGTNGNSVYVATVYQQSATQPATPVATASSYNFATNTLTPPAGWSITQPATTTTPTYACDYTFSGAAGSTVTGTGNWSTPYIEAVAGTNGTNGEYRDIIQLYLTSATSPTKPDTVQYYFSTNTTGTQSGGTAGWSLTRPAATTTPTYVTTALAATTTPAVVVTVGSWSTPVIAAQNGTNGTNGSVGTTGDSSRICYTKTTLSSLASTPVTITTAGSSSFPANASWGAGTVWQATAPLIVAGESVYQSDGVYSPTTGNTVWNVPYLSNLKVGSLSAITTDTGTLTVGTTGHIKGGQTAYNTGTGFFLGYSSTAYKFSIGSSTTSMTWDGTALSVTGGTITGGTIQTAASGSRWVIAGGTNAMQLRGFYATESTPRIIIDSADGTCDFSGRGSTSTNNFSSVTTLNTLDVSNTGGGVAIFGDTSGSTGYGGNFKGNATKAPLFIEPSSALPTNRTYGSVCFFNGWLCFANGTHWFQSNGTQLT